MDLLDTASRGCIVSLAGIRALAAENKARVPPWLYSRYLCPEN